MISVEDLRKWADEHAIGRSPSYLRGWVSAKDLLVLARMVEAKDPLNFYYSVRSNLLTQEAEKRSSEFLLFGAKQFANTGGRK